MAKKLSLNSYSRKTFVLLTVLLGLIAALLVTLIVVICLDISLVSRVLIAVLLFIALTALSVLVIVKGMQFYQLYYKQGIEITKHNVESLVNLDRSFEEYQSKEFDEINKMNESFKKLSKLLGSSTLSNSGAVSNLDKVPLEFEGERVFVRERSLVDNLKSLVLFSQSYRIALIDISYDLGTEMINSRHTSWRIYQSMKHHLQYKEMLVAFKDNKQGFLVYLPSFDSLKQLEEELEYLAREISLLKRGGVTKRAIGAKVSMVVYPYSDIDHLLDDLNKAKKQNKALNIYVPDNDFNFNNKLLFSSMNLNSTIKLIEDIASIDPDPKKYQSNKAIIHRSIKNIANYFGFNSGGYISYDYENELFINEYVCSSIEEPIIKEGNQIDPKFIDALARVKESGSSYYFADRIHVNNEIGYYVDRLRVSSGIFYVLSRGNKVIGVIYFLNRNKDLSFDAYMKQSLIASCHILGGVIKEVDARRNVAVTDKRLNEILKVSNMRLYSIKKDTYEFVRYSDQIRRLFPKFDGSLPCYKAMYGLDAPCATCPLKNHKHMKSVIEGQNYEVYQVFSNKDDPTAHMLIQGLVGDEVSSRFDNETMLSSFSAFHQDLSNQLLAEAEGKVLLLRIKNSREIVSKIKTGGYLSMIKQFADNVLVKYSDFGEVYQFNNSTIGLILHGISDEKILEICQEICEICKDFEFEEQSPKLIYLVKNYHKDDSVQFIEKALLDGLSKYKNEDHEEIVFIDTDYKRSASLEGYLLEQLLLAFKDKIYQTSFIPLLSNNSRLIYGVEIIPELYDVRIDKKLDMERAASIAFERGQGAVYLNGIFDYLNGLISKYTYAFFVSTEISKLCIKVDHNFVSEPNFIEKAKELVNKNQLPKDFICFEVDETDVHEHEDVYKSIVKQANDIGVMFLVREYEAAYYQVAQLAEMGFKEIKFSENTLALISDQERFQEMTFLWLEAVKNQMKVSFTGVDSRKTSESIVFEGYDCGVSGDYYFKPMDENKAFETIRERNMKDKDNLDN